MILKSSLYGAIFGVQNIQNKKKEKEERMDKITFLGAGSTVFAKNAVSYTHLDVYKRQVCHNSKNPIKIMKEFFR